MLLCINYATEARINNVFSENVLNKQITSRYVVDELGINRIEDNTDYPYECDSQVLGSWKCIDIIDNISDFKKNKTQNKYGMCIEGFKFFKNSTTDKSWLTWTKGIVIDKYYKLSSGYFIKDIKDRNNPLNYELSKYLKGRNIDKSNIIVPGDFRTTAGNNSDSTYVYWGEGGFSWAIPYVTGLAALAWQVNPNLTFDQILDNLKKSYLLISLIGLRTLLENYINVHYIYNHPQHLEDKEWAEMVCKDYINRSLNPDSKKSFIGSISLVKRARIIGAEDLYNIVYSDLCNYSHFLSNILENTLK